MAQTLRQIRDVSRVSAPYALCLGVVAGVGVHLVYSCTRLIWPELLDVDSFLGSAIFSANEQKARELGLLTFLCLSGAVAYGYSLVLWSARRSGPGIGLHLALYHYLLDGLLMGLSPTIGFFALTPGWPNALFLFSLHLAFGGLFGLLFDWSAIRDELPLPIDAVKKAPPQPSADDGRRAKVNALPTTSEA